MTKVKTYTTQSEQVTSLDVVATQVFCWDGNPSSGVACVELLLLSGTVKYNELLWLEQDSFSKMLKKHPDLSLLRRSDRKVLEIRLFQQISRMLSTGRVGVAFRVTGLHTVNGQTVFVAGDRLLGYLDVPFILAPSITLYHLRETEFSSQQVAEELLQRLQNNNPSVCIPVFAFTLLTSLQSLVLSCGIPLTSVLYLAGPSGFGKTETAKKFFALYDIRGTEQPALITEAGSTLTGLRNNLLSARDLPVTLDDLCISSGKISQQKRVDLASQILHEATNKGAIRVRMGGSAQCLSTQAGLTITAEFPLSTISDVTRCLIVHFRHPMKGGRPDDRMVTAGALEHFLTWFLSHYEEERLQLKNLYSELLRSSEHLDRLQTGLFCLRWAFDAFLRFALSVGAISPQVYSHMLVFLEQTLTAMDGQQRNIIASIQRTIPKATIPALLIAGLKSGDIPVTKKKKHWHTALGLIQKNNLLIAPHVLLNYLTRQDGYQGLTAHKLGRELKVARCLVLHESDHSCTVKVGKDFPRVYHILLDALEAAAQQA